jgi:hypothetical protein
MLEEEKNTKKKGKRELVTGFESTYIKVESTNRVQILNKN